MKRLNKITFLITLLLFINCNSNSKNKNSAKNNTKYKSIDTNVLYEIKKHVDGDTFWVDDGSEKGIKLRLIGIDAPESRNMFKIKEEPFGKEASSVIKEIIGNNKVRLETDIDKFDQFGRTLVYVYLENNLFINQEMIKRGYAQVATYPPNVKNEKLFYETQIKARENKLGMWKDL